MKTRIIKATAHKDVLGAGAAKRKKLNPKDKIHAQISEFKSKVLPKKGKK